MEYIVAVVLLMVSGEYLVMPVTDLGPKDLATCNSIGFASYEYAQNIANADGWTTVVLPDGSKVQAKAEGWACVPTGWL